MWGDQSADTTGQTSPANGSGGAPTWMKVLIVILVLSTLALAVTFAVFYGMNGAVISDDDDCEPNPCRNDAECIDRIGDFYCICPPGFTGQTCSLEINNCKDKPCLNGATCRSYIGGYECDCPQYFSGERCEIRERKCDSVSCENGATCIELREPGGHECLCAPGFESDDCSADIDECNSDPCKNGATCLPGVNSFTCQCAPGWTGTRCEFDIDECDSPGPKPPCANGGRCVDGVNSYSCQCAPGWEGDLCETNIDDCLPGPCRGGVYEYSTGSSAGTDVFSVDSECDDRVNSFRCKCTITFISSTSANDIIELGETCEPQGDAWDLDL